MRTSNVTATIAGSAGQTLLFTLVVPSAGNPTLQYSVTGDPADGTLFPVPFSVSQVLDGSGTLGSGIALPSPQDIELWNGSSWIASGAYYQVTCSTSSGGFSAATTNFAYSGSTRDLSTLLAATPTYPYTTAPITIALVPPTSPPQVPVTARLSTPCYYAPGLIVPTTAAGFDCLLATNGTGTLNLIPNDLLTPVDPTISLANVSWIVSLAGISVNIQVPAMGGALVGCMTPILNGQAYLGFTVPAVAGRLYLAATCS